jgi:hypothetical protein
MTCYSIILISKLDLTPVFNQYLRHTAIPALELKFDADTVSYRWKVDEQGFAMPVKVGTRGRLQTIRPPPNGKP